MVCFKAEARKIREFEFDIKKAEQRMNDKSKHGYFTNEDNFPSLSSKFL